LEVTESVAVDDSGAVVAALRALRSLGMSVAVDDFGTGYSALSRLRDFPVDTLKIDRSFVQGIQDASDDSPIVEAVVSMAHGLDLEVVAEGVETDGQRAFLERLGCDHGQGYLFSRPVEAEAIV